MVALRATMHVALHIADDKAFAKLVPADKKKQIHLQEKFNK